MTHGGHEAGQEPHFKFKGEVKDESLKSAVIEAYRSHSRTGSLPQLAERMKNDLDEKMPKGWIVFAGKHMVGACSYIQDTLVDFEVDGTSFVVFKTFCP